MKTYFIVVYKKTKTSSDHIEEGRMEHYADVDALLKAMQAYIKLEVRFAVYSAECICDLS